jgi:hypothetical protein
VLDSTNGGADEASKHYIQLRDWVRLKSLSMVTPKCRIFPTPMNLGCSGMTALDKNLGNEEGYL